MAFTALRLCVQTVVVEVGVKNLYKAMCRRVRKTKAALKRDRADKQTSSAQKTSSTRDAVFADVLHAARVTAAAEPALEELLTRNVLQHSSFDEALAYILAQKMLGGACMCDRRWKCVFLKLYTSTPALPAAGADGESNRVQRRPLGELARIDLKAVKDRDPACDKLSHVLLNFKGYQALQCHRAAHVLWHSGRKEFALAIQSKCSEQLGVDIHPAAYIGAGLLIDHATGVVVGETASIGDNCTILHGVTLGSSGKVAGVRHPKLGNNVLVGALTTILGNIQIGDGAKIGASSVVLKSIPPKATAVGVPAKIVGRAKEEDAGQKVDSGLQHVQSFWHPDGESLEKALVKMPSSRRHWNDIWDNEVTHAEPSEGYITRSQLASILQNFGASEAQSDMVFFALDRNLDNRISESEFNEYWPDVVAKCCPKILGECEKHLNDALKASAAPPAPVSPPKSPDRSRTPVKNRVTAASPQKSPGSPRGFPNPNPWRLAYHNDEQQKSNINTSPPP